MLRVLLRGAGGESFPAKVVDGLTGVYTASYVPKVAGSYAVAVLYNQLPIFGSPYTTVVSPGRAHAPTSVVPCLASLQEDGRVACEAECSTKCLAVCATG